MENEARFAYLKELAATIPEFGNRMAPNQSADTLEWLGRLYALLNDPMFGTDSINVMVATDGLGTVLHQRNAKTCQAALYRAIATVELRLPASSRGSFIPAGNAFDAITATSKILGEAEARLLIVDPYLGPKVLESFAIQAREGVKIELLGARGRVRDAFEPVARAWLEQYTATRPLSVRLVQPKQLHDRLIIIDDLAVWDVSQSFENLAARSPATLAKAPADVAQLKVAAYRELFDGAEVAF